MNIHTEIVCSLSSFLFLEMRFISPNTSIVIDKVERSWFDLWF